MEKRIYQSDDNLEAKHRIIEELVEDFIDTSLKTGVQQSDVETQLKSLCYDERLVPSKLHDWCFQKLKSLSQQNQPSMTVSPMASSVPPKPESPSLFCKETVYHAMLLCATVDACDDSNYEQYLSRLTTGHLFEQVSMSGTHTEKKAIDRCIIAKKRKALYITFRGEPNLNEWCQKYSSFTEGIV